MEATNTEDQRLAEQAERMMDLNQGHSTARAHLDEACTAMSKAVEKLGEALGEIQITSRALGGAVVEIPMEKLDANGLKERTLALSELDAWIEGAKAARARLEPVCMGIAEMAIILHNAEHGQKPDHGQ